MKHYYSVVRFVPYPLRGEFINVAVIAGSEESGEWAVHRAVHKQHAQSLGGGKRLSAVWHYLDRIEALIRSGRAASIDCRWLEQEHADHRNVIQLTAPVTVSAASAKEAADEVFKFFVADPEKSERRTRTAAVDALRGAFQHADLPTNYLHEKVIATVGPQRIPVDFAVANGHLVQLAHAWSFRVQRPEDAVQRLKAWSWTVRDLRDFGGTVRTNDGHDYPVDRDVEIGVAYTEPESDRGRRSLDEALDVLDHARVRAVSIDRAGAVAEDAVQALARG